MQDRSFRCFFGLITVTVFFLLAGPALAKIQHDIFLPNTEHELHVYRVKGTEPGKTIMIIGGIQGDEPGGYMTADLYADINLRKGNLIVVPRANFYSILLNRREGRTGDMNRKFGKESEARRNLEEEVVSILKGLIAESDCLLNLHEGSGFYAPQWVSEMENPRRFGQSIIFDSAEYGVPDGDKVINLEEIAGNVAERVNKLIPDDRYKFKLNNHNTISASTMHQEQRLSATYYALTRGHIPAFGLETSKSIQALGVKIQLQKLLINAFMEEFDIILDSPGVYVEEPKLDYLLVRINNGVPLAMRHDSVLELDPGDEIVVSDIIANYPRGLVADIDGWGSRNDTRMPYRFSGPTRILVRKDAQLCGWVDLKAKGTGVVSAAAELAASLTGGSPSPGLQAEQLLVSVQDEVKTLLAGETLRVPKGTRLVLKAVRTNRAEFDDGVRVNFKGFSPPKGFNDGNDLNFPIYTDQDLLSQYSVDSQGVLYPVEASHGDQQIGIFWVEVSS